MTLLSALLHGLLVWRLVPALSPWPVWQGVLALLICASAVGLPMGLVARRVRRQPLSDRLALAGFVFMGWFSSMFVLTLLREAVLGLARLVAMAAPGMAPSASAVSWSAMAVGVLGTAMTALGWWNARRTAQVVHIDVPIADLPSGLHGFTIAQISDIHVGPTIKAPYLQAIVDKVNGLKADMVAITGDLVDGSVHELAPHVRPLAGLQSRHGSYFVMGNHDYYSGGHDWIAALRHMGLRVLLNEHVVLEHEAAAVVIAGVTDFTAHHFDPTHKSDPHAAGHGAPGETVKVLLAHQPRSAPAAAQAGFDLQLSGHTHGGQFWPWRFFVPLQQPYVAGLHRLERMWIYVSRGTGYWGPPKRFGAPSEITLLRLVRAG
jgi:hypothetical protein